MTLQGVRRFSVEASTLQETVEAIRAAGLKGFELFVVWSGVRDDDTFTVVDVHVPRQVSYKRESGLCVRVDGSELHRLNVWLYEAQQEIGVQVHGHPREAYHSETDDAFPIATLDGSLSIVLPFFGRDGWASDDIAAYRLGQDGWLELTSPLSDVVEVVNDGTR